MTSFHITQFGCRATQADGAAIERQLRDRGCRWAEDPASADVLVLNTCTVTAAADAQARDAIRKMHALNSGARIIVTGCYAQRAPEELAALPGVWFVVGNSHKPEIPALVGELRSVSGFARASDFVPRERLESPAAGSPARILTGDIFSLASVLVAPVLGGEGNHTRPTVKIQDGCNSRCSFCVIPFVRGRSRSLPLPAVLGEIRRLTEAGFREVVLSGIHLGSYGRDLTPRVRFAELLGRILEETSVERLRLSSIEPLEVNEDLVALVASQPRIAPHFHMPLQSASDAVLGRMHRPYRAEHYARRVELVHSWLPQAALGADVLAGFPGETEEDHERTLRFLEERPFTYLHIFSYSSRPGTQAALLPGHLPGAVRKRRARELRALGEAKAKQFLASQLGRLLSVLTLRHGPGQEPGETPALSGNYLPVRVAGAFPPNRFLTVRVTGTRGKHLIARPAFAPAAGAA